MFRLKIFVLSVFVAGGAAAQPWHTVYTEDSTPAAADVVLIENAAGDANYWVEFGNFRAALALVLSDLLDVSETGADLGEALVSDGDGTWSPSAAPAMLTSTQAQDAQIAESNVTQHQAALAITESQISDLAHTADTDTTCNDAGVVCLFAGSASEGGAAATGDSATAFFSAGTIEHERGGLEADVSAYGGLVRIAAGSTSAVTDLAGLNTALGSTLADGAHTTDTNAGTVCSGSLTYLDGEGNCDTYTLSGSTTELATVMGTTPSGECVEFDASGNLVTSGGACGGGGGAATSIDADADATSEVSANGTSILFDPDDDGVQELDLRTDPLGQWVFRMGAGANASARYEFYDPTNTMIASIRGQGVGLVMTSGPGGAQLTQATASLTVPSMVPYSNDFNTGIGADGSDNISLIAGGINALEVGVDGVYIYETGATMPTCSDNRHIVSDGDGSTALCWCDGTTWQVIAGSGDCA